MWFNAVGQNAEAKARQFYDTLYGRQMLWEDGHDELRQCLFFNHSSFFSHREILDAAVCSTVQNDAVSCQLLLNPLSPRYTEVASSEFRESFGQAVEDPLQMEAWGECLIMDPDINRSNEVELIDALRK